LERATEGTTYRAVFEDVAAKVTQLRQGKQHPQMEGKGDRVLFGLAEIPPMRYVRLSDVNDAGTAVTLTAGAALGVTMGTEVALYPVDTVSTDARTPLARATVTEVRPFDSTAVLIEASITSEVSADARAVLTPVVATDVRRPVRIDTAAEALVPPAEWVALKTLLGNVPVVRLVDQPEPSAITVTAWPAEHTGIGTEPSWMLTGVDGQPVAPPKPLDRTVDVVSNIVVLARQALAMALDNADPKSSLARQRPTMQLLRQLPDGSWQPADPAVGGLPEYQVGENIGVRIHNPRAQKLHFSLLMFGLSGKVMPLYPPDGATEFLAPGQKIDLFTESGREAPVGFPEVYPYVAAGTLPVRTAGQGTLKLFVTSTAASFGFLHERVGVRSDESSVTLPPDTALQLLFEQQMGVTRDVMPKTSAGPVDDWTTVVTSYVVRRAPV
jgi:hypothetical protein